MFDEQQNHTPKKRPQDPFKLSDFDIQNPVHLMMNPGGGIVVMFTMFFNIFYLMLRGVAVTTEVFVRSGFGERYLGGMLFMTGLIWLGLLPMGFDVPSLFGISTKGLLPGQHFFHIITFFYLLRGIYLLFVKRWFTDIYEGKVHGHYDGTPLWFLYRLPAASETIVRQFYEPLFILLCGVLLTFIISPYMGSWLFLSSFGMFLKEYVKSQQVRNMLLDQIDAEISARNMAAAIRGESPTHTQGFYIAGLPKNKESRERLADMFFKKNDFKRPTENDDDDQSNAA